MKNINLLTFAASLAFTTFIVALSFGLVSMPVFLISFTIWISLLTVYSYTPKSRSWLPRTAKARLAAQAGGQKAALPLAA